MCLLRIRMSRSVLPLGSLTLFSCHNSASALWRRISIDHIPLFTHEVYHLFIYLHMWFLISSLCLPSQYWIRWPHKALILVFCAALENYIHVRGVNAKCRARISAVGVICSPFVLVLIKKFHWKQGSPSEVRFANHGHTTMEAWNCACRVGYVCITVNTIWPP